MIQSSLKQRIASGEQIIGANISMTHCKDELKKIVESGNFDFLWIDSQHCPFNEELLVSFCAKAADLNAPVIFRIIVVILFILIMMDMRSETMFLIMEIFSCNI